VQPHALFACLSVLAAILASGSGANTAVAAQNQLAAAAPQPPSLPHDRIGIYHWGMDTVAWPGNPDKLRWGADAIAGFGSRTIRVALGARDDYGVNNGAANLAAVAAQPAYAGLFGDSRFSTYLLTVYSTADLASNWSDGYTAVERRSAHAEVYALGRYLLENYAGKSFIVLNWEGDNALSPFPSTNTTAWDGYVSWLDARAGAVAEARRAVPWSSSRIYSGLEFNAVKRLDTGAACDTSGNKCVISYVAPRVGVDFYSYSSWQSLSTDTPTADVGTRLSADLTTAYNFVAAVRPGTTHAHFLVGEIGSARDISGECDAANRISKAILAVQSWGAAYGIIWQMYDNVPASGIYDGFGLHRNDRSVSLAGQTLKNLYTRDAPIVPPATCGSVNPGGIVDGRTFTPRIQRGQVISIFGGRFSPSGNVVWLKQGSRSHAVTIGSQWWYESANQINLTLPAAVVPGTNVKVNVVTANGLVSNGQLIDVLP
jgi:hypothetical protein